MTQFMTLARALKEDDSGATMIEYTLLAGLVSVVIIALLVSISGNINTIWTGIDGAMQQAADSLPAAGGGGGTTN